jgi:hypothetical protein
LTGLQGSFGSYEWRNASAYWQLQPFGILLPDPKYRAKARSPAAEIIVMAKATASLKTFRTLAEEYESRGEASMRDRFLVLAADEAFRNGDSQEAERLRHKLLQANRHHLLRPYSSFAEACCAYDVSTYLQDLRLNYPTEAALSLLLALRGEMEEAPRPALTPALDSLAEFGVPPEPLQWGSGSSAASRKAAQESMPDFSAQTEPKGAQGMAFIQPCFQRGHARGKHAGISSFA